VIYNDLRAECGGAGIFGATIKKRLLNCILVPKPIDNLPLQSRKMRLSIRQFGFFDLVRYGSIRN